MKSIIYYDLQIWALCIAVLSINTGLPDLVMRVLS